jgi:carboxymethylenebutenolidase
MVEADLSKQLGGLMAELDTIEAGDSTVRASIRVPDGARAGVVVLHPWWGLNDDVIAYADRLAAAGYAIVAPDMFGGQIATEIEDADRLSGTMDEETGKTITLAAVDRLAERLPPGAPLAALGFSFGAAWAIWAPIERGRVVATVVYYGTWTGTVLGKAHVPVLGHFAEDDPYETAETVAEFEQGLRDAGREATIHRYPGAGHWFAEPSRDAYRPEAAELAFERTIAFLEGQQTAK